MTYGKRTRGISSSGPAPSSVQTKSFVADNLEDTTAAEGLGVGLALDLEHVEG